MRLPSLLAAFVAVSAAIASVALAQTTPAPTASPEPAAAPSAYPPHTCKLPTYPGKAGTDEQRLAFNRDYKAYGDCIRKYVDDARAASNSAIEAGNKAVIEYNKYAEDVKKQIAADQGKSDQPK